MPDIILAFHSFPKLLCLVFEPFWYARLHQGIACTSRQHRPPASFQGVYSTQTLHGTAIYGSPRQVVSGYCCITSGRFYRQLNSRTPELNSQGTWESMRGHKASRGRPRHPATPRWQTPSKGWEAFFMRNVPGSCGDCGTVFNTCSTWGSTNFYTFLGVYIINI